MGEREDALRDATGEKLATIKCAHCGGQVGLVTFGWRTQLVATRTVSTPDGPAILLHYCPGAKGRPAPRKGRP